MYKCKECGAEYEEKPDYCDCGNDEFEEVNITTEENTETQKKQVVKENKKEAPAQKQQMNEQQKVMPASSMRFNNSNESSYIPKRTISVDPLSLGIFGICILLSLYIVFFAWNVENQELQQSDTKPQQAIDTNNIPSIDKFWNSALPVVKSEPKPVQEQKTEEVLSKVVQQIIPVVKPVEQKKTVVQNKATVQSKTVTQNKPTTQNKTTAKSKTTAVTSNKTTTTNKQQTTNTVNTQAQAQQAAQETAKQKADAERKAAEAAQIKKLQAEQAKKAAEEKTRQAQISKQELATYKANLRNTVARKIDFTRVIGDGSCTVSFRIDSSGNLINRSFTKQSTNNTLNDAVYNAVMSTPTFNPPPSAYNNEMLNLNIKFYNGNFEISLP